MSDGTVVTSPLIREGLEKLQAETFAEGGLGFGADEVVSTSVIQQGMARRYENVLSGGTWGFRDGFIDFSHELMDGWLLDVRSSLYVPGPDGGPIRPILFISFPMPSAGWKFSMKRS